MNIINFFGKNKSKQITIIVFVSIIILSSCYLLIHRRELAFKYAYKKISSIPTNYTCEQLINYNFADVDVTSPLKEPNKKIDTFIKKVETDRWATLKAISYIEPDELCVTLYIYDDRINEIRAFTRVIKKQASYAPDRRFSSFYSVTENGINYVYLIGLRNPYPDSFKPDDELLYSYYIETDYKITF